MYHFVALPIYLSSLQVCRHFLLAIEKAVYGWFWECPNGERCIYRHALPQGFVFKKALKEQEELQAQDSITLEELVENEVCVFYSNKFMQRLQQIA